MNGKLVPILIGALLTIIIGMLSYLVNINSVQAQKLGVLNDSVIRIEESMWTKDNQTNFMETKFYPLKGKVDGILK